MMCGPFPVATLSLSFILIPLNFGDTSFYYLKFSYFQSLNSHKLFKIIKVSTMSTGIYYIYIIKTIDILVTTV